MREWWPRYGEAEKMTEQGQKQDEDQTSAGRSQDKHSIGQQSKRRDARGWRLVSSLLAISALGPTGFSFLGQLVAARENRPVTEVRVSAVRSLPSTPFQKPPSITPLKQTPAASLQQGLRRALKAIQSTSQSQQRRTTTIKAAYQAAEVGAFALGGSYEEVLQHLGAALQELRFGQSKALVDEQLSAALKALDSVPVGHTKGPTSLVAYRGAAVINSQGIRVGMLDRIDKMTGEAQITLGEQSRPGGHSKGKRQINILARDLIFGPRSTYGETLVLMPTSSTTPDRK